jgi:DNA mismatch endonuclease (patch repair protein)
VADTFTPEKRSEIMSKIRGKDTTPELLVRSMAHRLGYRFRLHYKILPGTPDLVFPRLQKAIFVNGCFWHTHTCRDGRKAPKSNAAYWGSKRRQNQERDKLVRKKLRKLGWKVFVIWECQCGNTGKVEIMLKSFLGEGREIETRRRTSLSPAKTLAQ